jgi:prepilin-type N-terminal cleavage/methylation domain-containing protein
MNKRRGFTLVELLVVLFIIVLLVAVGLPRVRDYGKRNGLRTAAQEIKSQILYAQALARTPDRKGVTQYVFMINFSNSNYCLTTTASPAVCVPDQPNVIAKISQNYMIVYAVGNAGADNSVVKPPTLVPSDIGYYNSSGTDSCPNDSYYSVDFKVPSAQM